jgi:hypothetical protein
MRFVPAAIRLLAVLAATVLAADTVPAATVVELHWDRALGESVVIVRVSGGVAIAELPVDGPLPTTYSAGDDEIIVPTLIVAGLRDQLVLSADPEAPAALGFVRELLGPHADTPIGQIPPTLETGIGYGDHDIDEWCGASFGADGECEVPVSGHGPFCVNAMCKATAIRARP